MMEDSKKTLYVAYRGAEALAQKMKEIIYQHYSNRRLIIKGLHPKTSAQELGDYFAHYGIIDDVFISGNNSSYAFITFSKFNGQPLQFKHEFNGRTITIEKLAPLNNPQMKTKVILANGIFNRISVSSLINYFSKYGKVQYVKKQRTDVAHKGISRFAYISFSNYEAAELAVSTAIHLIENQIVDVRKARSLPNE